MNNQKSILKQQCIPVYLQRYTFHSFIHEKKPVFFIDINLIV